MKKFASKFYRAHEAKKKSLLLSLMILAALGFGVCSCKAWRTVTTSATYVLSNDSTQNKTTTTISTKTVEEYTGVKKK